MLWKLYNKFQRKNFYKVKIFQENGGRNLIDLQRGNLGFGRKINLAYIKDSKRCYLNYEDLIFWTKSCYCKLFFSHQLYFPGSRKRLSGGILLLFKLPVIEVDCDVTQSEELYYKTIFMLMSISRQVFLKKRDFSSLLSIWNKAMTIL